MITLQNWRRLSAFQLSCTIIPGALTNVLPETLAKMMREIPSVIGVKECSDYSQFLNAVRLVGNDGAVFSGSDLAFADQVLAGAKGGVIAASCVLPAEYAKFSAWPRLATPKVPTI